MIAAAMAVYQNFNYKALAPAKLLILLKPTPYTDAKIGLIAITARIKPYFFLLRSIGGCSVIPSSAISLYCGTTEGSFFTSSSVSGAPFHRLSPPGVSRRKWVAPSSRPDGYDPDRASARVYGIVDVIVIGDCKAATVYAKVRHLFMLPHARFKLAEVRWEASVLLVIGAE
jgi:hypothetical protein